MDTLREELIDLRMAHAMMEFFDGHHPMQKFAQLGLLDRGCTDQVDMEDFWTDHKIRYYSDPKEYMAMYEESRKARLKAPQPAQSVTHAEWPGKLLEVESQSKAKPNKKRLKKKRQKERKRLEKLEKEKQQKDDSQRPKDEDSTKENDMSTKANSSSSVKCLPAAETQDGSSDSDSSDDEYNYEQESGSEEEELDLTSTFVSKAALKIHPYGKAEKEKMKPAVKKPPQPAKTMSNEYQNNVEKNTHTPTFKDNVKRSTDLAVLGNTYASAGQFDMAVKYFTDAIKYNPTEFKLFGNRSFCFEKMQQYEKALADAQLSLNMCPGWVKGLYRKGRALAGLKRYDDAAQAFKEVLKLDRSSTDAAQELMRVQITHLMEYGFSREQSSNALIIHGTVNKSLEVLSQLHCTPGAISINSTNSSPLPAPLQIIRASPLPSAQPKPPLNDQPLGPVQNMFRHNMNPAIKPYNKEPQQLPELFPIWVGNVVSPITESMITDLFSSVGQIHSVKHLSYRKCAFVNYTCKEHCEEAIRQFHGYELGGANLAVRYPDRIPSGKCFSRSAHIADHLKAQNFRLKENPQWKNGACDQRRAIDKH